MKDNLYLIDGDNNLKDAIAGIPEKADETDDIRIFCSQIGNYRHLKQKKLPHTKVIYVKSKKKGDQAVDNRIKAVLGNAMKDRPQNAMVISQDKGYDEFLEKKRKKFKRNDNHVDRRDIF